MIVTPTKDPPQPSTAYCVGRVAFLRGVAECPFLWGRQEWGQGWNDAFVATYRAALCGGATQKELSCLWEFRNRVPDDVIPE